MSERSLSSGLYRLAGTNAITRSHIPRQPSIFPMRTLRLLLPDISTN
jgi:hypothetical protein